MLLNCRNTWDCSLLRECQLSPLQIDVFRDSNWFILLNELGCLDIFLLLIRFHFFNSDRDVLLVELLLIGAAGQGVEQRPIVHELDNEVLSSQGVEPVEQKQDVG